MASLLNYPVFRAALKLTLVAEMGRSSAASLQMLATWAGAKTQRPGGALRGSG
jgi:hypothetical protein